MPKDYAAGRRKKAENDAKPALLRVCVFVLVLIVTVSGVVYLLYGGRDDKISSAAPGKQVRSAPVVKAQAVNRETSRYRTSVERHKATAHGKPIPVQFIATPSRPAAAAPIMLQLASVVSRIQAQALQEKLRRLGFATVIDARRQGKTTIYRVQAGPYASTAKAQAAQRRLYQANIYAVLIPDMDTGNRKTEKS